MTWNHIPSITMSSDSANCKLHNSYDVQSCALASVSLLFGGLVCFYDPAISLFTAFTICPVMNSYRLFKLILFLVGFLMAFFLSYMFCSEYLTDHLSGKSLEYKEQIVLGISVAVGLIAGLLTVCLYYVGLFVLGAAMGWFIGMAVLPLFYKHSDYLSDNNWVAYLILVGFAIAGGILILCIQKAIIIISSSFLGAFWCINGFDYFLENSKVLYYSVSILHGRYSKSDVPHCWYTWLILSLIPAMFIAGVVAQYFKTAEGSDHREAYGKRPRVVTLTTPMRSMADQQPILEDYE